MKTTLSLAQFQVQLGNPDKNFQRALELIHEAAARKSHLILLPELWTSGYDLENCEQYAPQNQEILLELQKTSQEHQITIGGSYITRGDHGFYNSFILVCPQLGQAEPYQKIHLFRHLDEHIWFLPGKKIVPLDLSYGRVGQAICYDLRFPEMFRAYANQNVQLMLLVSQWGAPRTEHWRTFLRSRAIENQFFLVAVNAVGYIRANKLAGFSAIVSPWGEVICEASGEKEELLTSTIDLADIDRVREILPAQIDSRRDLYADWYPKSSDS